MGTRTPDLLDANETNWAFTAPKLRELFENMLVTALTQLADAGCC
jgi:hypothetical protein